MGPNVHRPCKEIHIEAMSTKKQLITTILRELREAQTEKWTPPKPGPVKKLRFPPTLALGNGEHLKATEALRVAVFDYARLWWSNDRAIKPRFKIDEFAKLVEYAFANVLAKTDSDRPDEGLVDEVEEKVRERLNEDVLRHRQPIELTVGCHLFEGESAYPLRVGPVVFETREQWRQRLVARNKLSCTSARRLEAIWSGKPMRSRKGSADFPNRKCNPQSNRRMPRRLHDRDRCPLIQEHRRKRSAGRTARHVGCVVDVGTPFPRRAVDETSLRSEAAQPPHSMLRQRKIPWQFVRKVRNACWALDG